MALTKLDLAGVDLDDPVYPSMPVLRSLRVMETPIINLGGLLAAAPALHSITFESVRPPDRVDTRKGWPVRVVLPELRRLVLRDSSRLRTFAMPTATRPDDILLDAPKLRSVDLILDVQPETTKLQEAWLTRIMQQGTLQQLVCTEYVESVTCAQRDGMLARLADHARSLRRITIYHASATTASPLCAIIRAAPDLEYISVIIATFPLGSVTNALDARCYTHSVRVYFANIPKVDSAAMATLRNAIGPAGVSSRRAYLTSQLRGGADGVGRGDRGRDEHGSARGVVVVPGAAGAARGRPGTASLARRRRFRSGHRRAGPSHRPSRGRGGQDDARPLPRRPARARVSALPGRLDAV